MQRSVRACEGAELSFLYLHERFVLPVKILLRSEFRLIFLQQTVNPASRANTGGAKAPHKDAERVWRQHTRGVRESHEIPAQFPNGIVQDGHLAAILLVVEKANSPVGS